MFPPKLVRRTRSDLTIYTPYSGVFLGSVSCLHWQLLTSKVPGFLGVPLPGTWKLENSEPGNQGKGPQHWGEDRAGARYEETWEAEHRQQEATNFFQLFLQCSVRLGSQHISLVPVLLCFKFSSYKPPILSIKVSLWEVKWIAQVLQRKPQAE